MKVKDIFLATAAALGGVAGAVIAVRVAQSYRRDQRIAVARLVARGHHIETDCGPVEYAEDGAGPAVLVLHGAGGGFDQGLDCVGFLSESGLRFIAPSRFGYLGSPLPPNATPEAQADSCAALLDTLKVERACVMGFSAGGMSAAAFALRHPARCQGLILVSAITRPLALGSLAGQMVGEMLLGSDFAFWAMSAYCPGLIAASTGVSAADQERLAAEPEARRGLQAVLQFDPVTRRRDGMLNDIVQAEVLPAFPLEQITTPTLVVHGTHDPLVPFHFAAFAAQAIPGARLLILEGAGHLGWFTHAAQTRPAALEFLAANSPGLT